MEGFSSSPVNPEVNTLLGICCRHEVSEERKVSSERSERMRVELESLEVRLEEERRRSADLLLQVALTSKINGLKNFNVSSKSLC